MVWNLAADDRVEIATIEDLWEAMRRVEGSDETVVICVDGDEAVLGAVPLWLRRRTPE